MYMYYTCNVHVGGANVGGATTASSVYTIGHTPSADGTNEKGNESVQFFIGWSLGARVGLIVGCLVGVGVVATCLLCLVCLVCCCYKCLCKQEKSDRIGKLVMAMSNAWRLSCVSHKLWL